TRCRCGRPGAARRGARVPKTPGRPARSPCLRSSPPTHWSPPERAEPQELGPPPPRPGRPPERDRPPTPGPAAAGRASPLSCGRPRPPGRPAGPAPRPSQRHPADQTEPRGFPGRDHRPCGFPVEQSAAAGHAGGPPPGAVPPPRGPAKGPRGWGACPPPVLVAAKDRTPLGVLAETPLSRRPKDLLHAKQVCGRIGEPLAFRRTGLSLKTDDGLVQKLVDDGRAQGPDPLLVGLRQMVQPPQRLVQLLGTDLLGPLPQSRDNGSDRPLAVPVPEL